MSILINMEMPTSCGACRFCGGIADTDCGPCAWCDVDGKARVADTRQDCPLVPVPEHGNQRKPITNYDRIISKTPEELADFLNNVNPRLWKHETWLKWLKQETDKKETEG